MIKCNAARHGKPHLRRCEVALAGWEVRYCVPCEIACGLLWFGFRVPCFPGSKNDFPGPKDRLPRSKGPTSQVQRTDFPGPKDRLPRSEGPTSRNALRCTSRCVAALHRAHSAQPHRFLRRFSKREEHSRSTALTSTELD